MFNLHSVNTAEVNAGSRPPESPVLSILISEDVNTLSWTSALFTDFFEIYWSAEPFNSIDDPGVHKMSDSDINAHFDLGGDPSEIISYPHVIPAAFSLSVLYYRVQAYNKNSATLSNQVDNYNFKLAIYEEIYKKTLDDFLLRFTPEIRRQYEDSQLWRSFVQSLCSELAQSRFEIKEALKQLNIQKAVNVFLNMWNSVTGISRINVTDPDTGLLVSETDEEYRQRLVDNVFWDKISNLALKKTMLLKLGYDSDVLDSGISSDTFKIIPENAPAIQLSVNHGLMYFPGETIYFLFIGPNGTGTCLTDDGTTLTYTGYSGPAGSTPYDLVGGNTLIFYATPTAPPVIGKVELAYMGGFDTSTAMNNWLNYDSENEGPLDYTVYTFRPTAHYSPPTWPYAPPGALNPTYAYDGNINSYAEVHGINGSPWTPSYLDVYGFPNQGASFATLNLKIKARYDNFSSYIAVSLNAGSSWSYYYSGGAWKEPPREITHTIAIPGAQVLSQIIVRAYSAGGWEIGGDPSVWSDAYVYLYEVWLEGSGIAAPGVSAWSSEYGGTMKLQYGKAERRYILLTQNGDNFDLSFEVKAGSVYIRVGSTSGGDDIVSETLYGPGIYTLLDLVNTTSPYLTYVSFHVHGTNVAYVDNVSCLMDSPSAGTIKHAPIRNVFGFWVTTVGTPLEFVAQDGITKAYGKFISNIDGVLTFENTGTVLPHQFDYVKESATFGQAFSLVVLLDEPTRVSSSNSNIHPKLLSNVYSVNLGTISLSDSKLNEIYDEIFPLAALGNVLIKILKDLQAEFSDWDVAFGNIPYGAIFMGASTYDGAMKKQTDVTDGVLWSIGEELYLDNQWKMSNSKIFYGNDGPDDIVILTRTT